MTLASLSLVSSNFSQIASPIQKQNSLKDFHQENETFLHVPKMHYFNDLSSLSTNNHRVENTSGIPEITFKMTEITADNSQASEISDSTKEMSETTYEISEETFETSEATSKISEDTSKTFYNSKYSSTTSFQKTDYENYHFKNDDDHQGDYTYFDFLNISDTFDNFENFTSKIEESTTGRIF